MDTIKTSSRIPCIDGLRGFSIALVLVSHSAGGMLEDFFIKKYFAYLGELGVSIFFAISGYLITRLLLEEENRNGYISISNFYIRRTLRILPPFLLFLLVMLVFRTQKAIEFPMREWFAAAGFIWNYLPGAANWWLSHTWSLAVEEQFYLLWPLCLTLLGFRRSFWVAVTIIGLSPLSRYLTHLSIPEFRDRLYWLFHTRADTLLFGCAYALMENSEAESDVLYRIQNFFQTTQAAMLSLLFLFLLSPLLRHAHGSGYLFTLGYGLEALAATSILVWVIAHPTSFCGKFLMTEPMVHLGFWSYGVYLWQQFFLHHQGSVLGTNRIVNFLAPIAAGALSYYGVEKVFEPVRAYFHRNKERKFKERVAA